MVYKDYGDEHTTTTLTTLMKATMITMTVRFVPPPLKWYDDDDENDNDGDDDDNDETDAVDNGNDATVNVKDRKLAIECMTKP